MHLNVFYIDKLARELNDLVSNKRLTHCFSTSISEVFFCFDSEVLRCQFFNGELFYQVITAEQLPKKNRLNAFPDAIGKVVKRVNSIHLDRAFIIHFDEEQQLVFYNYGRFGSIVFYQNNEWNYQFPIKSRKVENLNVKDNAFVPVNSPDEAKGEYGYIPFDDLNGFEYPLSEEQWKSYIHSKMQQSTFCITKQKDRYKLVAEAEEYVAKYDRIIDALTDYTPLFIGSTSYVETKRSLLSEIKTEMNRLTKRISKIESVLSQESTGVYKEYADLLMANMYKLESGNATVELTSFDGQKTHRIKLNKDLSPQANAEKYYRKAKNEYKNREVQEQNLKDARLRLLQKQEVYNSIEQCENYRELKKFVKNKKTESVQVRLPYRRMDIDGFEIRIGKGAKDNDEMLRSYSSKNDLWLHAKDVAGSHVIVRTNGENLPNPTLEKIAAIAAYYSKAKGESLVPVIYTERKFVRKPKGAHPGLVKVDREDVVLVEPSLHA